MNYNYRKTVIPYVLSRFYGYTYAIDSVYHQKYILRMCFGMKFMRHLFLNHNAALEDL